MKFSLACWLDSFGARVQRRKGARVQWHYANLFQSLVINLSMAIPVGHP